MTTFAIVVLLVVGCGIELLCCIAMLVFDNPFDRLHFLGPASSLGPVAVAIALVIRESFSVGGLKALLVAGLLTVSGPVLSHATARAGRVRQYDHWRALPEEVVDGR